MRGRASHLLQTPGASQGTIGEAELLQDGFKVQIQVKIRGFLISATALTSFERIVTVGHLGQVLRSLASFLYTL